jgi:hypothetical protein
VLKFNNHHGPISFFDRTMVQFLFNLCFIILNIKWLGWKKGDFCSHYMVTYIDPLFAKKGLHQHNFCNETFFNYHNISTKFLLLSAMINFHRKTCGTHKVSSYLPIKFSPYAVRKQTSNHIPWIVLLANCIEFLLPLCLISLYFNNLFWFLKKKKKTQVPSNAKPPSYVIPLPNN